MSAIKSTMIIGGVFFVIRLILAIICGFYAQSVKLDSNWSYNKYVVISISFAIGALIDLGLIIGSNMKNKIFIFLWIGAQFLVGKEKLTTPGPPWLAYFLSLEKNCMN